MTEAIEPKDYKKRVSTIQAVQWDGSLNSVGDISGWVLEKDSSSNVTAMFTSSGIELRILSAGQLMNVTPNGYIAFGADFGLATFVEEAFNAIYEVD